MPRRFQFSLGCLLWLTFTVGAVLVNSPAFYRQVDHDLTAWLWPIVLIWGAYQFRATMR